MSGSFIVILKFPRGPVALVDEHDNILTFKTADAARDAAMSNTVAVAYGANIIDLEEDGEVL